jgi:glycosyltransferase involved in cell wall biosynthesis
MKLAIVRREPNVAISMDVYADNLVAELKVIRPDWKIVEVSPQPWSDEAGDIWHSGNPLRKFYERFYNHPRVVNQIEADLFHIIDHTDAHLAYGLKKIGKPVIVTCHDLVQYIYPEVLKNEAKIPAFSMAVWQYCVKGINAADRAIAISTNTAKDIDRWLNTEPEKVAVVPNGVGSECRILPPETVAEWKQQYTKSEAEICLLHVGTNHHRKNVETVFKALKAIVDRNIPVRLWKVGEDFYPEQKQYLKDNNLTEHITLVTTPDREAVIKFYNAADILIAPSLYEGFGLTILEAMACGTPTITANVSSIPEVAGNAAVLVEPTDVDAITQAILRIDGDAIFRQDLIDKGLARVREFTWRKTAEKTANLYEQVVKAKSKILA